GHRGDGAADAAAGPALRPGTGLSAQSPAAPGGSPAAAAARGPGRRFNLDNPLAAADGLTPALRAPDLVCMHHGSSGRTSGRTLRRTLLYRTQRGTHRRDDLSATG